MEHDYIVAGSWYKQEHVHIIFWSCGKTSVSSHLYLYVTLQLHRHVTTYIIMENQLRENSNVPAKFCLYILHDDKKIWSKKETCSI